MNECPEDRIAHYRMVSFLGQGGMGAVYRAHDERLDRDVALKLLPCESRGDENARARLLREARTASALNHTHIAHIYEVGDDGDNVYLAMELVEGRTLQESIPPGGFPAETLLRYATQIASALDFAHERGIIHRDLKSTNIMINGEGAVKVLDFGLARRFGEGRPDEPLLDPNLTVSGMVVGTPNHLPPEVLRGEKADPRSDVWALGVVLYEMASGRFPFHGTSMVELASAITSDTPRPLSGRVPVGVQAVIARCLAKEPTQRYHDGGEVYAALEALLGVHERRRERKDSRRPWIVAAAALVVVLAAAWAVQPGRLSGLPAGALSGSPGATRPAFRSLAVLPLANLSGDPAQEYFADGMTEELITNLAPIPGLKVISRTSAMRYKGSQLSLTEIAKALGVDAVVEGSVQRVGNRVRITAQLIEAATDRHLWAKSFDRDFDEILTLQTEVARDIAHQVQLELTPSMNARLAAARPVNPRAYELVLKGRYEWSKLTEPALRQAGGYFEQALAIDPGDARASSGLADTYLLRVQVLSSIPAKEGMAKVKEFAARALAADPNSAEARASNAAALLFGDWDFAGAEAEVLRAIDLNPGYSTAHLVYSVILTTESRLAEAIDQDRAALELDPMSILVHWNAVNTLRAAHRYDEAFAMAERGLKVEPGASFLYGAMLRVLEQKGDYAGALDLLEKRLPPEEGGKVWAAKLRQAYAADGPAGYWRAALSHMTEMRMPASEMFMTLAFMYSHLGERDRALDHLEKAYAKHVSDLLFIRTEPAFAFLHAEPRFQELVRKVGFPVQVSERTSRSSRAPLRSGAAGPSRG
ncbi:MAG: protein kinase [Candidatus Eisenbacteria bacterium]